VALCGDKAGRRQTELMAGAWVLEPQSKWAVQRGKLGRDWKRGVVFPGIGRKFFCK